MKREKMGLSGNRSDSCISFDIVSVKFNRNVTYFHFATCCCSALIIPNIGGGDDTDDRNKILGGPEDDVAN
ncbi:MAG: hypothetical protein ACJAVT_001264 [Yoonia sp.]|jgi:hypothetical protein